MYNICNNTITTQENIVQCSVPTHSSTVAGAEWVLNDIFLPPPTQSQGLPPRIVSVKVRVMLLLNSKLLDVSYIMYEYFFCLLFK